MTSTQPPSVPSVPPSVPPSLPPSPPRCGQPGSGQPHRRAAKVVDWTVAALGWIALAVCCWFAVIFSFFFVMASDGCGADCRTDMIGVGMIVVWVGVAVGLLVAALGTIFSAVRSKPVFCWPLLAIALVVAATFVGATLANSVLQS